MDASQLTDADISVIERRLADAKFAATVPRLRPLTGWEKKACDQQEAKRLERIAGAQAKEERLRRNRERAAERRRIEWEANAPKREAAKIELAKVGREIAALESQEERLWDRARELEQDAKR